ncbi:MAG: ATP-binding cassette domain-containing protein [Bacteriovoracaceae bacterium]
MENILIVDGVTKEYPGRVAVDSVSFTVKRGSIHGFLGPNGAGKTTTMRMIAGLLPATSGTITLFGDVVRPEQKKLKNQLGLLPENPPLYHDMTVEDYLRFVGKLHHVSDLSARLDRIIVDLNLKDVRKRLIGNLSKGYKQRVGLSQAIIYDAPFLILDEPTNGLDPQSVVELREFIKKLAKEKTILFSSHILSEVEQICDHITIIHKGKVRASGDLKDIHKKFRQGLVIRIGLASGENLPDLSSFGKYDMGPVRHLQQEDQYHLSFENEMDIRPELLKYLVGKGLSVHTMMVESPELEDIFLHMTENRR